MEYTVVITRENSYWRAVASEFPKVVVEAPTRDEVIAEIKNQILEVASRVEVLKIEIPDSPNGIGINASPTPKGVDSDWKYFGVFKEDPTWGKMLDEAERQRDQRLVDD